VLTKEEKDAVAAPAKCPGDMTRRHTRLPGGPKHYDDERDEDADLQKKIKSPQTPGRRT
jgi:hypothetical protein